MTLLPRLVAWGLSCLLLLAAPVARGETRFAIVVGNNAGHDRARALRFAEKDARKVYAVLRQLGGVPKKRAHLLLGRSANEVLAVLQRVSQQMAKVERSQGAQPLLVFYYSGHAERSGLGETGQTTLGYDALNHYFRRDDRGTRVAFIDACGSGRLVAMKGGRPGPAFRIALADEMRSSGYAIVTSSSENELSQESASIRGSFFTHYLVSSLRGAADSARDGSGDGVVTLAEAYRYIYARTIAITTNSIGGVQHPMYGFKLSGRGNVVLTRLRKSSARLQVKGPAGARIFLLDGAGRRAVGEFELGTKAVRIALAPGSYLLYQLHAGQTRRARVTLRAGELHDFDASTLRSYRLEQSVSRGGLFARPVVHRVSLGGLLRRMPLAGGSVSYGGALAYRLGWEAGWYLVARGSLLTAGDTAVYRRYIAGGLQSGVGYRWSLGPIELRAEARIGYEYLAQASEGGERLGSSAAAYFAEGGLELPLGQLFFALDGGVGGRILRVQQAGWVHRLDWQATASVGWRWGMP